MFFYVSPGGGGRRWPSKCKRVFSTGDTWNKKKGRMSFALCSIADEIDAQLWAATAQLLMEKFKIKLLSPFPSPNTICRDP